MNWIVIVLQIYLSLETSLLVKDTISLLLQEWMNRERVEQLNSIVKSNGGLLKKLSAPGALFIWIALDENCKHWSNCIGNQQDCSNDMMQSLLPLPLDLNLLLPQESSPWDPILIIWVWSWCLCILGFESCIGREDW